MISRSFTLQAQSFNNLLHCVQDGDLAAASRLQRVLGPVVSRAVRQAIRTRDFSTPLGRRVQGMLAERHWDTDDIACDTEETAQAITQAICGQTVARLRTPERLTRAALDTVCA
jgi:hypothetical protein